MEKTSGQAVSLNWKNIRVTAVNGRGVLLKDLCGRVHGRFLAIMGPSGSGKTTLMNVLARRSGNVNIEGESTLNTTKYSSAELKRMSGYVMQDDQLNERLTVEETLIYTANLRMSRTLNKEIKRKRVEEVIIQMGLQEFRNMMVGDPTTGIPGGARKRLCTAMELLTSPRLLFLDEPTTGLDSTTALSLCSILRDLAHSGACTVVCTIHQPASQIFNMFDDLLLLTAGRVIYHGPAQKAVEAFSKAGHPCPANTNPADHLLDVVVKYPDMDPVKADDPTYNSEPAPEQLEVDWSTVSWLTQTTKLFQRALTETVRNRTVLIAQMFTSLAIACLIGSIFLELPHSTLGTRKRLPLLFFCTINQGMFGSLAVITTFPSERMLILRERAAGTYKMSSYFFAKTIVQFIQYSISPILFSIVVYWMTNLQPLPGKFFIFVLFMILCTLAATSMAILISAVCRTTTLSLTILPMALEVFRLFGGYFLSPANLPNYFAWLDILSFFKYAYVGAALNEMQGLSIICNPNELIEGRCPYTSGEYHINLLGLNKLSIEKCILALLVEIVGFRLIAYVALRYIKN